MPTCKVPDRIVDLLLAEGVDTLYGIPDPSFFGFIEAEQTRHGIVSPHHEQAGALMRTAIFA